MFSAFLKKPKTQPKSVALMIEGQEIPLILRRNKRAKRLILRRDRKKDGFIVTLPPGCSSDRGVEFAYEHLGWMSEQLKVKSPKIDFHTDMLIPLRGILHTIKHCPKRRGVVWLDEEIPDPVICVAGDEAHIERRIKDWLKKQARNDLHISAEKYANELGLRFKRISLRDQTSRWGSCSSSGNLSFSWRLVLAPPEVLDYVAAHEVAHMLEMNHSKSFWDIVERLKPDYQTQTKWLKKNGSKLHQYF